MVTVHTAVVLNLFTKRTVDISSGPPVEAALALWALRAQHNIFTESPVRFSLTFYCKRSPAGEQIDEYAYDRKRVCPPCALSTSPLLRSRVLPALPLSPISTAAPKSMIETAPSYGLKRMFLG